MRKESVLHWTGIGEFSSVCTVPGILPGRHCFLDMDTAAGPVKLFVNDSYAYFRKTTLRSFRVEITRFLREKENFLRMECLAWKPSAQCTVFTDTDPVHFDERLIHLKYLPASGRLLLEGTVWNHTGTPVPGTITAKSPLFGDVAWESSFAAGSSHFARTVPLQSHDPWSPAHPVLYPVTFGLESGTFQDTVSLDCGIRSFRFESEDRFILNGTQFPLKSLSLREEPEEKGLSDLKQQGIDLLRVIGHPPSRSFLDVCDRMGFLVADEAFSGRGTTDFISEERERNLSDMVLRDRNHPSVILWSIGEGPEDADAAAMAAEIAAMDMERPVSDGIPGEK